MEEQKKFKSGAGEQLKVAFFFTLCSGLILSMVFPSVYSMLEEAPRDFAYIWFTNPLSWPVGFLTCGIFTLAGTCFFKTRVIVGPKQVVIHQFFKTWRADVAESHFVYQDTAIKRTLFVFKFTERRKYLKIWTEAGDERRYRMYFFGEKQFNGLQTALTTASISEMPVEERVELRQEIMEDGIERKLYIGRENLIENEKKRLVKTFVIYVVVFALLLLVSIFLADGMSTLIKILILMLALILVLAELPIEVMIYLKNKKRCPDRISYQEGRLRIGDKRFSMSEINQICITSPLLRSSSIIPVQHYIEVHTGSGILKYWVGSAATLETCSYQSICNFIKEAFLFAPEKVKWSTKQSLMNQ